MLFIFSLVSILCLTQVGLNAWERTYPTECKAEEKHAKEQYKKEKYNCRRLNGQEAKNCKARAEDRKKQAEEHFKNCKREAEENNEASFINSLNEGSQALYAAFTPHQKVKAMDLADKNKMSPDDAVAKIKE